MTPSPQAPWPMKALRRLVTIRSSNVDKIMEEGEEIVRLCNYVDVYYNDRITGHIEFSEASAKPQEITKFGLRSGDVVITKDSETPDDIAVPALVDSSAEGVVCGYHLAILRPKPSEIIGPFLFWSLKAKPTRETFGLAAQGVTRYGLTLNGIASVNILVPDLITQKAIATFLDRETARIDQLIAKKKQQVELLTAKIDQFSQDAVTVGLTTRAPLAQTTIPWLPQMPAHWESRKAKHLFKEMARAPLDDDGVITAFRDGQVVLRTKRRTDGFTLAILEVGYQHIQKGDLVIHSMDAFAGAIGVSEDDGKATGEYVVCSPKNNDVNNEYYAMLLRCMAKRNYVFVLCPSVRERAPRFRFVRLAPTILPKPPIDEQNAIVAHVRSHTLKLAEQREKIERSLRLLNEHRAALITAAVTGQLDIHENLPTVISTSDRDRFRLVVGAEIIHQHRSNPKFGRVKLQKELYLAEAHLGISELQGNYFRQAAGPLDRALIEETERAVEAAGFYSASQADGVGTTVTYTPLSNAGRHSADLKSLLGPRADALGGLIALLRDFGTEAVEAVATLYAVWNDALMDGRQPDDSMIVNGVLTEWHEEKGKKFKDSDLRHWLDWMKRNGLTPRGQGPRTAHTMTRDMFA
ncbi:restriction endonuclease subunit S [Agrobacterium rhizogenes]|nr:restriction endonuclease subunit S [Rhizobium rhizogenes]NTJ81691.1 restriction endonuclease subunit S [Rhizobium rhizogenes]